jgi:Flp pilus assembly protein TadB
VNTNPENDRAARANQARRVIAGSDVRPPSRLSSAYLPETGGISPPQRTYFIALAVLLVLALILWFFFGLGVASVIFFLLALTLIAGWLVF